MADGQGPGRCERPVQGRWELGAILVLMMLGSGATELWAKEKTTVLDDGDMSLRMGGAGGVYLLASPGELVIELEKRDLNEGAGHSELRALLVSPDRRVLQEVTIPDDGQPAHSGLGPPLRARLSTQVERPGIYAVNITVSQDRYGVAALWGFRTNCARYLIETSRGHKDERHQEPIVLRHGEVAGDVCFAPRPGQIDIEVTDLPADSQDLLLYDGQGELVGPLPVDAQGQAWHAIPPDEGRGTAPWRLHLPASQATVHIDGVTRWDRDDAYANLSLWTDELGAYFPLAPHRWMLTPYSRTVYGEPGSTTHATFRVHANGPHGQTYDLAVEFDGEEWPVNLSAEQVTLVAGEACPVTVEGVAGADGVRRTCRVRITPQSDSEVTTYASFIVQGGEAPAAKPLAMPLALKPYEHENEQLGYLPDYTVENEMYFDPENRPFVWTTHGLAARRDRRWSTAELTRTSAPDGELPARKAPRLTCTKIAFDSDGDMYALGQVAGNGALLHSVDGGRTITAYSSGIAGGACDVEQWSGHNPLGGPPPVLHSVQVAADDQNLWRRICTLDLYLPSKENGRLVMGEPIRISDTSLGVGSHSGIPSAVVSREDRVHVIWAEPTDPEEDVAGVPTYVVTYDRTSGRLGQPALIGYGAPPNDVHNRPSITMDSKGYLHALAGTHGQPFQYARSLQPNEAGGGWTDPVPVGDRQTYIGLVCGPDDVLHLVFRWWRYAVEPFPHSHHATLAYQRKRPGQPWEPPRPLLVAPFSEYSIFYHKLVIDCRGRLFLNYDYWSTFWFYRNDHHGRRRSVMMSADGGDSWKLVATDDLDEM